jgi:serine/threonine protein kinase
MNSTLNIGNQIDRYFLISPIGSGNLGTVYLASDPDFEGEVAIKLIPGHVYHGQAQKVLFEQEARLISLLEQPNIVPVHDIGELQGNLYIVMRHMVGGSLAQRLASGPLDIAQSVRILSSLANTLDTVHNMGLVHRDLKPENILFDEEGNPHISDFGMFKLAGGDPQNTASVVCGAPEFMAPEEALGSSQVDNRADVYALGALLFTMLTGKHLFTAPSLIEVAAHQVLLTPPDIHQFRDDLPAEIQIVLATALAKNPDDRYESTIDLAVAFIQALGEDVLTNEYIDSAEYTEVQPAISTKRLYPISRLVYLTILVLASIFFGVNVVNRTALGSSLLETVGVSIGGWSISPTDEVTSETQVTAVSVVNGDKTPVPIHPTDQSPSATDPLPSPTYEPEPTPELRAAEISDGDVSGGPIIGGADKLAFVNADDVWMINLDGTGLERLTDDMKPKSGLRWTPDGNGIVYYSQDKLIIMDLSSKQIEKLNPFKDFVIVSDMSSVIIGDRIYMDRGIMRWRNFIYPYDLSDLKKLSVGSLKACIFQGGWLTQISQDGQRISTVVEETQNDRLVEVVQLYKLNECSEPPQKIDSAFGLKYSIRGYNGPNDPLKISDYSWDGINRLLMTGKVLNGFGDLIYFDFESDRYRNLTPIPSRCCYREPRWSPDGNYIFVTYMDIRTANRIEVFYSPVDAIENGETLIPISIPSHFFQDRLKLIQPALRRAN